MANDNNKKIIYKKDEIRLMRITLEVYVNPGKDSTQEEMLHATLKEIKKCIKTDELPHVVMELKDITDDTDDEDFDHDLRESVKYLTPGMAANVLFHEKLHKAEEAPAIDWTTVCDVWEEQFREHDDTGSVLTTIKVPALSHNQARFIQDALNCGLKIRSYSGRGMYGRKCPGVEIISPSEIRTSANYKMDSMGMDYILYAQD